ncbi:MAG: LacI family DNA-binding transcriptional regulator [Defluviitaleaceae bacterium]|nr:LacI family DNA-binding transcriptional regulator [Defluviitaleaceae bacterium]
MGTIKDVAKRAGVSISTVSHVVNKTRYVSPQLIEKVQNAINELDTPPNFILKKRSGIKREGKGIVFLRPYPYSFFCKMIEGDIFKALEERGYFLICVSYNDYKQVDEIKKFLQNKEIKGAIVLPKLQGNDMVQIFEDSNLPLVVLSNPIEGLEANYIVSDAKEGTYKAIRHFIRNGHERIAFLSTDSSTKTSRYKAYCDAIQEKGLELHKCLVHIGLAAKTQIYSALDTIFECEPAPSAIFIGNTSLVVPFIEYINIHDIKYPQDISIICFNDFEWYRLYTPPISVVSQDIKGIAREAVKQLADLMENKVENKKDSELSQRLTKFPANLIIRSSTSGIAHGPFGEMAGNIKSLYLTEDEIEEIARHNYTSAISFHYTGRAWMNLLLKGINSVFKQLNISLIATTDALFNPALQTRQLESIVLLEPDIIISMPTDNKRTAAAFKQVSQKAKLVLITNVPEGLKPGDYVSCVSVNERSHGRNIGQGLGEYMEAHNLKNAIFLKHGADFYGTNQRDKAAEQVLEDEYPHINICADAYFLKEEDVYDIATDLIKKYPETEAMYISWEGPALQAMKAINGMNRQDIAICTGDLDYNIALAMAKGGAVKSISAQNPYEQGEAIALSAANAMLGKPTPSFIGIEPVRVTSYNLLKTWPKIFKEEPPQELIDEIKKNFPI